MHFTATPVLQLHEAEHTLVSHLHVGHVAEYFYLVTCGTVTSGSYLDTLISQITLVCSNQSYLLLQTTIKMQSGYRSQLAAG